MGHEEILRSIDNINDSVNDVNIAVLDAMLDSCDKATTIMENYDGDDLSSFSIFQEGKIMDEATGKGKNDSTIKKIALFIPRLVIAMVKEISKSFKNINFEEKLPEIPKVKIEKVEKDPGLLKKIIKSKQMKTIVLVGTTVGAVEISNIAKDMINTIKSNRKAVKEINNNRKKRKEILEKFRSEYKPIIQISVGDDGLLYVQTTFDINKLSTIKDEYIDNINKIMRRHYVDIRNCKNPTDVISTITNLENDLFKDTYMLECITGVDDDNSEVKLSKRYTYGNIRQILNTTAKSLKNDDGSKIKTILDEFYKAIPYDKMDGIVTKAQMSGNLKERTETMITEGMTDVSDLIISDMKLLSQVVVDVFTDLNNIVKGLLNIDTSTIEGKNELMDVVSGKTKYEMTDDGNVIKKKTSTKNSGESK